MKILTLIKYSLDVSEIKVDPTNHELRLAGVPEKVGNIDKNVVEAAVRLKEAAGGAVQALCLGPAAAREGFKDILAMGVDEVFLVEDPFHGQADASVAIRVLDAAVRKLGPFDLVVCGFASDDGYSYQVGPRLAERLGLPFAAYVREMSLEDGVLRADRDQEEGMQRVSVSLPAVVSVAEEAFSPRRTTLMDAIKAKKKPVNLWALSDVDLSQTELESLSVFEQASQTGVVVHRKQQVLKSQDMVELADRLIDALVQENVLKGGA
jgi:electron transfer flavoprotein beta subunit